jgi:hypothetical protein
MFPIEGAVDLLKAYRAFMEDAPDEICSGSAILCAPPEEFVPEEVRGKPVLAIIGCYVGPIDAGEAAYAPLREWGPALNMMQPMPYTIVQQLIAPGNPPGRQHYWKAGFLDELSDAAIETFVKHATTVVSPFQTSLMLPLGGAFARAPEGETPLNYRQAKWDYHVLGQWADPADADANITWVRDFDAVMAEYAEEGIYVNFVAEPSASAVKAGFGDEAYARMVAVKDKYDPDNVFRSNTNIPPSGS